MKKIFFCFIYILLIISISNLFFYQSIPSVKENIFLAMENTIIEEEGISKEDEEELNFQEIEEVIQTSGNLTDEPSINSKSAIVWERNTKQILFEKNSDKRVKMASTTKIMTAIIVMENAKMSDVVKIEKTAAQTGRIATRIENKRRNYGR